MIPSRVQRVSVRVSVLLLLPLHAPLHWFCVVPTNGVFRKYRDAHTLCFHRAFALCGAKPAGIMPCKGQTGEESAAIIGDEEKPPLLPG